MPEDPHKDFLSLLELMAALSPWCDVGNASAQPFLTAFAAARKKALTAASAYAVAVNASQSKDLKSWLGHMAALKRWADVGNPDSAPFVDAFSAARARALASA
jgi:hypothetical protein